MPHNTRKHKVLTLSYPEFQIRVAKSEGRFLGQKDPCKISSYHDSII